MRSSSISAPFSQPETVWRDTPSLLAASPCDKPIKSRAVFNLTPRASPSPTIFFKLTLDLCQPLPDIGYVVNGNLSFGKVNMLSTPPSRKARFKAALALSGIQMGQWAEEAGISRQHLNATLNDEQQSEPLTQKVDAFIADVERRHKAVA